MRLEQGIQAAITALSPTIRCFAEIKPQGAQLPCVTFQRISTTSTDMLVGVNTFRQVRVQFDVWGTTVSSAQGVADRLRTLLEGFSGDLGGVTVQYVSKENDNTLWTLEGDRETRRVSMDFMFMLHE